jgi:hypothetical protein
MAGCSVVCIVALYQSVLALQANKMDSVAENYSKSEVHTVVRFLQAEGASQSEIHRGLVSIYGQSFFS